MADLQIPSLSDMLRDIVRGETAGVQTGMPARVVSFSAGPPARCSVQPLLQKRGADGTATDYPVIPNVPVHYPAGGGFRMSWPLVAGDQVWLMFGSRDLTGWKREGEAAPPSSSRRGDLSDAVAFAGFAPASGEPLVEFVVTDAGKLRLGSPSVDIVAKLKELVTILAATTAGPDPLSSKLALEALEAQLATLVDS